ncbi:MAG: hypothetical protein II949_03700 [Prevotella sp.]|nr:hypothetical protein [Prevotella sp.]
MRYHDPHKKNGTITIRVMCAVVFMLFCFLWLYLFQGDVMAYGQHVLSGGQTHYDRTVGAVIITVVLQLLQLGVYGVVRLARRTHALTYLPSMLTLAVLSRVSPDMTVHSVVHGHWWIVVLILVAWGGAVWLSRHLLPFADDNKELTGLFSQRSSINLLIMVLMMLGVVAVSNTEAVFHFRAHAEAALQRGDVDEVLRVGSRSHETDESLTMLRIHALARQGQLGERLFDYPIVGRSTDMLPLKGSRSRLLVMRRDSLLKHLGGRPLYAMDVDTYLHALQRDSLATPLVADYLLCSYLIDRNLTAFAEALPTYYPDSVALPRYYREALQVYHQRDSLPKPAMDNAARLRAFKEQRNSYWFYYYYH